MESLAHIINTHLLYLVTVLISTLEEVIMLLRLMHLPKLKLFLKLMKYKHGISKIFLGKHIVLEVTGMVFMLWKTGVIIIYDTALTYE